MAPFDLVIALGAEQCRPKLHERRRQQASPGGIILASTLVAINACVAWLAYRNKTFEGLVEGRPVLLIHDGQIDSHALQQVQMTMHELEASLLAAGYAGPEKVRFAILENSGRVFGDPNGKGVRD